MALPDFPDFLGMAEAGLLAAVAGEWEIIESEGEMNLEAISSAPVWGRAIVRCLKNGTMITNKPQPFQIRFRHCSSPTVKDIYQSAVTIHWGANGKYATLDSLARDCLIWKLPFQEEEGLEGEKTYWRRMPEKPSTVQVAEEVKQVQAKAADELANTRARATEEVREARAKAADEVAEARSKAAIEIVATEAKASDELVVLRAKVALLEAVAEGDRLHRLTREMQTRRLEETLAKVSLSDETDQACEKVADEVTEAADALRARLNNQVASSESYRKQLQAAKRLVTEMVEPKANKFSNSLEEKRMLSPDKFLKKGQETPEKDHLHTEVPRFGSPVFAKVPQETPEKEQRGPEKLLQENLLKPSPDNKKTKLVRQQEKTPDKELPMEKKRRTDIVGNDSETVEWRSNNPACRYDIF